MTINGKFPSVNVIKARYDTNMTQNMIWHMSINTIYIDAYKVHSTRTLILKCNTSLFFKNMRLYFKLYSQTHPSISNSCWKFDYVQSNPFIRETKKEDKYVRFYSSPFFAHSISRVSQNLKVIKYIYMCNLEKFFIVVYWNNSTIY